MKDTIKIPKGTTIGYLTTKVKNQLPNTIPDFPQLFLGIVLSQKRPDGREHSVAYASRSLSPTEKNYGTSALKHLAIYWAVTK
ncbi:hypothetical protein G9A89_010539 [Geosiphon pyriformis]|nr:hypothetical protein G9A89_010539 [Geosiphon pyriformis]